MPEYDPDVDNLAMVILFIILGLALFALYWRVNG